MNNDPSPAHAALLLIAAACLNSLHSAMPALNAFKSKNKKLQADWAELRRLTPALYADLTRRLDGPSGDYLNSLSNASEAVLACLVQLPVADMNYVVRAARLRVERMNQLPAVLPMPAALPS